jgi:long-chain fatty acid transport protein
MGHNLRYEAVWTALAIVTGGGAAYGSGFGIQEQGVTGLGQAFAGAAAVAEDASTNWFNPAGLSFLGHDELNVGGHAILPHARFTDAGSARALGFPPLGGPSEVTTDDAALVPNLYLAKAVSERVHVGLGVNVPFGLITDYDPAWVGRYHAIRSELKTININPNLAFRVSDKLALGAGFHALYADVELSQAIDQLTISQGAITGDGLGRVSGADWGFGYGLGLMYQVTEATRVGLAYHSEIAVEPEGTGEFLVDPGLPAISGGAFVRTGVSGKVDLPQSVSASVVHDLGSRWTLLGDFTWTGWSSFPELRFRYDNPAQPDTVTTVDWEDTFRVALGGQYHASDALTLRAGFAYDESPVPSPEKRTPRIPDSDRYWLSVGGSYQPVEDIFVDLAYSHIFMEDAKVDNALESAVPALRHVVRGEFESAVDIFSLSLRWRF